MGLDVMYHQKLQQALITLPNSCTWYLAYIPILSNQFLKGKDKNKCHKQHIDGGENDRNIVFVNVFWDML